MIGRRMVTAGVVVVAVTAGGVAGAVLGIPGLSGASSSPSLSTTAQSSTGKSGGAYAHGFVGRGLGADRDVLAAAAGALHLSTKDLLQKLSDGKTTIADVAATQKVPVQTVIDAMVAVAKTDISNLVNNPLPSFGLGHGKRGGGALGGSGGSGAAGPWFGGPIGPGGPMAGGFGFGLGLRGALGDSIDAVAKALGISSQELLGDLRNGQSIADIAKSKHVDVTTLINTLVTDAQNQIAAAAKAGHLPQPLAQSLESNLKQMITDLVNNAHPKGVGGLGGFGGFGRRGGRGGPGPAGSSVQPAPTS
jgi:hypothetical protein